jgi:hypothetical protein
MDPVGVREGAEGVCVLAREARPHRGRTSSWGPAITRLLARSPGPRAPAYSRSAPTALIASITDVM